MEMSWSNSQKEIAFVMHDCVSDVLEKNETDDYIPVIRLFGRTSNGESICAVIHDFPIVLPIQYTGNQILCCVALLTLLNKRLIQYIKNSVHKICPCHRFVKKSQPICGIITCDHSNYTPQLITGCHCYLVQFGLPEYATILMELLRTPIEIFGQFFFFQISSGYSHEKAFLHNRKLQPLSNILLRNTTISKEFARTSCSLNYDATYENVEVHEELRLIFKTKILSIDIEVLPVSEGRNFYDRLSSKIVTISCVLEEYQKNCTSKTRSIHVFSVGRFYEIPDVEVHCFHSEKEMLCAWYTFYVSSDCDILSGYNLLNFDLPHLCIRGRSYTDKFLFLGRLPKKPTPYPDLLLERFWLEYPKIPGILLIDTYRMVKSYFSELRKFSLENVAGMVPGATKTVINFGDIEQMLEDNPTQVAEYCINDALISHRLLILPHEKYQLDSFVELYFRTLT